MCPRMRRDNTHTIKTKIRKRRRSLNSTQNEEEKTATQLGPKRGRDNFHKILSKMRTRTLSPPKWPRMRGDQSHKIKKNDEKQTFTKHSPK